MVKEADNKMEFFEGIMNAFKEQRQVDIWLKAGDQTDPIPAHKLILVARSKMFRNILESNDCKVSSKETITLSEMTRDELETFLEFMYNGCLPRTKLVKHVNGLYIAADKYEILYLQDICRNELISSLDPSNVIDVLELAKIHSDRILEDVTVKFCISRMNEISFTDKFMSFVESNPALTVQMIRGYVNTLQNTSTVDGVKGAGAGAGAGAGDGDVDVDVDVDVAVAVAVAGDGVMDQYFERLLDEVDQYFERKNRCFPNRYDVYLPNRNR